MMFPDRPVRSWEEQYTRYALNSGSGGACGQALAEHMLTSENAEENREIHIHAEGQFLHAFGSQDQLVEQEMQ
jgi:hypothetical protein